MKNKFFAISLSVLIFCFFLLPSFINAQQELPIEDPEQTISMDFQDAGLKDILKIFSIQSGLNFIASENVEDRKITLYLDKVPIKDALDKLFKVNNLYYEAERDSNIFIVKDWGRPTIETVTKVFYLKYISVPSSSMEKEKASLSSATSSAATGSTGSADSSSGSSGSASSGGTKGSGVGILDSIKELLSENGKLSEDSATNSIIVTDIPSRMPVIEQLIASLDISRPQVMLEVEMLDVTKDTADKLGLKFGQNPFTLILPGGFMRRGAEIFLGDTLLRKASSITNTTAGGLIFGSTYAEVLDFLKTQTDTKYLARPRILTLNNESAEIKISTNEAVGIKTTSTATGAGGAGVSSSSVEAERYETGVTLRVTPQINLENGEITMIIIPTVSEAKTGGTFGSTTFKDPEIRSTKSMVRVKDGETVVLGGLIRNEMNEVETRVPLFSDIPILGALFRHKDKTKDKERELLVFITPRIIRDSNTRLVQSRKVTVPYREQSALSGFDRQKTINSILNNLEK